MIALCLVSRDDRILVEDVVENGRVIGYRPLGGGVEMGEYTRDTVVREIREELGVEVRALRLVAVLENVFTFRGELGHEIVFVYDGEAADAAFYERETFEYSAGAETVHVRWLRIAELGANAPLFPEGLLPLLTGRN